MAATSSGRLSGAARLAPHLLAGAFVLGCLAALAHRLAAGPALAGTAAAGALAAHAIARRRAGAALGLVAVALGLGAWGWSSVRAEPPGDDVPSGGARGTIVVDTPPRPARGRVTARAIAVSLTASGRRLPRGARVIADLPAASARRDTLGARLAVTGAIRPAATAQDPGWWRAYLRRQGIVARLRVVHAEPVGRRGGVAGMRDRLRIWAAGAVGAGLSGDVAALVRGMALGGAAGLSEPAADAFRRAGLWHLLAVSGQNVAVVALAALAMLRLMGVPRRPAVGAAAAVMALYCLACDGGASVARAGIVGGLGLVAELGARPRDRWHLLLVGLAALLAAQPGSIGDPGLDLSFAAVAGLFTIAPPLAALLRGWLPGRLSDLAAQAAAATLATGPVMVLHFGTLSLAGLAVNVVAVPLAGPVVVLALAGGLAGTLLPALGVAVAWVAGLGAGTLLLLARAASALPGATVMPPAWTAVPLGLLAVAIPVGAWWLRSVPSGGRTGGGVGARPAAALAACLALAAAALVPAGGRPPAWPARPALTALDVGQGDAILLRSPDGATGLVDAGPGAAAPAVAGALRREGVRRVDMLLVTHDQADHVGGAAAVVAGFHVGVLGVSPVALSSPGGRALLGAARDRGVPVRTISAGSELRLGTWRLRVLWPPRSARATPDPNVTALVMSAAAGRLTALLTADAESDVLARLPLAPVAVLKVSHHGSADPGLPALLRRLRPAVALISVGAGNHFGHPVPAVEAALREAGADERRTDRDGSVTVAEGRDGLRVGARRAG